MNLQNNDKKIAIIGAGPSGILAATALRDAGYTNITIYGKFEEAQCCTKHIGGVVADVGTCYVHAGYFNTVKKLVDRFDINIKYLDSNSNLVNSEDVHTTIPLTLGTKIVTYLGIFYFLIHGIIWKFLKHTWAGKYIYGVSFECYLKTVGLGALAKSYVFGPGGVAQGYGFLGEVSAYRLFRWFRPSIFLTPIMNDRQKGTGIIVEGYGTLFKRIYDSFSNHIEDHVKSVSPAKNGEVMVVEKSGKKEVYASVIVACPLMNINNPLTDLMHKQHIQSTSLFSYLWTSKTAPYFEDRVYILDYITANKTNVITTFRLWGKTQEGTYLYWGVGYAEKGTEKPILKEIIGEQVNKELKLPLESNEFFEVFDYNLRFSTEAIREGIHLKVRKLQGKNNIWYSGGMLSHWDVDSIYEFDRDLVNKLEYRDNPSVLNYLKYQGKNVLSFFVNI